MSCFWTQEAAIPKSPFLMVVDESNIETGLWCSRCNLPSGCRVPMLGLSAVGVSRLGVILRCFDCDQPLNRTS